MADQDFRTHSAEKLSESEGHEISAKDARQADIVLDTPEKRWGFVLIVGAALALGVVIVILAV